MNAAADRLEDGFPHGTLDGYRQGCRGNVCPAGAEHGLSCKRASQLNAGDYRYQKLARKGMKPSEIADELGLNPDPSATAPAPPRRPRVVEDLDDEDDTSGLFEEPQTPEPESAEVEPAAPAGPEPAHAPEPDLEPMATPAPAYTLADFTEGMSVAAKYAKGREIREWCRANGFPGVPAKGIVPRDALAAYAAAHLPIAEEEAPIPLAIPPAEPAPSDLGDGRPSVVGPPASEQESHGQPVTEPIDESADAAQAEQEWQEVLDAYPVPAEQFASEILDETRARIAGPDRPEWGEVAAAADVERAREIAARLFLELTDAEAARDRAETALAVTLQKWDTAASEVVALQLRLSVVTSMAPYLRAAARAEEIRALDFADRLAAAQDRAELADEYRHRALAAEAELAQLKAVVAAAAGGSRRQRRQMKRAAS